MRCDISIYGEIKMFEITIELAIWVITGFLGVITVFLIQHIIREYREMASTRYILKNEFEEEKMKSLLEDIYSNRI